MTSNLRTTIDISTGGLSDYELEIEIEYSVYPGCAQTFLTPAEPASATIKKIRVPGGPTSYWTDSGFLGDLLQDDEELLNLCLLDWQESRIAAEDDRADAMREEQMLRRMGL